MIGRVTPQEKREERARRAELYACLRSAGQLFSADGRYFLLVRRCGDLVEAIEFDLLNSRRIAAGDEGISLIYSFDSFPGLALHDTPLPRADDPRRDERTPRFRVGYASAGRDGGTPVVFLHAFPLDYQMWLRQMENYYVPRNSRHVITPYLLSHPEPLAGMDDLACAVAEVLDTQGCSDAILVGLSLGGYVALEFYRLFPERVAALVLADTRADADTEEVRQGRRELAERVRAEGVSALADAMLPKLLAPETLATRPEVVQNVREMIEGIAPETACAALTGMAERADHTSLLAEINCPTLVIVGGEDRVTPPEVARAMHERISGSRLEVIRGAAHLSNVERPDEFNQALDSFLRSLDL